MSLVLQFNEAGEVLEAFNLRDERDGGHFDENMNYVFKKEKGEVDAWVAEMDEVAMEQAIGEAAKAVKRKAAEREKEEEREAQKAFVPSIQLKRELLSYMKPKETVSAAMRRLSGKNGKLKTAVHILLVSTRSDSVFLNAI
jgi:CD2 antigen cytoplasmic tail-binding protein 2